MISAEHRTFERLMRAQRASDSQIARDRIQARESRLAAMTPHQRAAEKSRTARLIQIGVAARRTDHEDMMRRMFGVETADRE